MNDIPILNIDEILTTKQLFDLPISSDFRDTLTYARKLTRQQKLEQVATYHMLSALIRDLDSSCSQALLDAGANLYKIEKGLKHFLDIPGKHSGKVILSAGSRKLLKITYNEANHRNDSIVEAEHLLLAFLKQIESDSQSIASKVLEEAKVDINPVYIRVSEYFN